MAPLPPPPTPAPTPLEMWSTVTQWCRREPLAALVLLASIGVLVYFFCIYQVFINGSHTTMRWAAESWNSENNQEHGWIIFPVALGLVWYHRGKLLDAVKAPSNYGLIPLLFGIATFLIAVRCLQPRFAVAALPLTIYGGVYFLYGRQVARVFLFPCVFLLFMIPVGGLVQGTVSLQLLVSQVCNILSALIGVKIEASGTTIRSVDGSFNFEIAEGCSGVRSLMAMITLTALYVHFTQRELWKKWTIFLGSIVFAVIGNIGRIFTVILVAKFIDPKLASGLYHDYSGFIFFPIAVSAMVAFGNLLNKDWSGVKKLAMARDAAPATPAGATTTAKTPGGPISYDY